MSSSPFVIGLCGAKGAGKTTLANLLTDNLGYTTIPFAEPLKVALGELLCEIGCSWTEVERLLRGDLKDSPSRYFLGKTPRFAMQTFGTEWGRKLIGENFWAEAWKRNVSSGHAGSIVVHDLRFLNEAEAIRVFPSKLIRIERTIPASIADDHISEQEYLSIPVDAIIFNEGSPEDMLLKLEERFSL